MTFNQYNVDKMYESIESVSKLGFRYLATAVDIMSEWSEEEAYRLSFKKSRSKFRYDRFKTFKC